jgi:hypothetical protein
MSTEMTNTYIVKGMRPAKQVVVRGRLADAEVRAAIDEAGYQAA